MLPLRHGAGGTGSGGIPRGGLPRAASSERALTLPQASGLPQYQRRRARSWWGAPTGTRTHSSSGRAAEPMWSRRPPAVPRRFIPARGRRLRRGARASRRRGAGRGARPPGRGGRLARAHAPQPRGAGRVGILWARAPPSLQPGVSLAQPAAGARPQHADSGAAMGCAGPAV